MMYYKSLMEYLGVILVLLLWIPSCGRNNDNNKGRLEMDNIFSVTLYDSDYSQAIVKIYHLDYDNINICIKSSISGETDRVVYERQLSEIETQKVKVFFQNYPLDSLETKYVNPNVDDGNQMIFMIRFGDIEKQIQVSNFYQPLLADLIALVNEMLTDEYKISYEDI